MIQSDPTKPPRLEFLDALRGLAILGVISTHCAWFAGGDFRGKPFAFAGLYGVQLFFMVSAFTIFMTLERALSREPALIRSFYIRRLLRILPMFWIGIVLYTFAPGREHHAAAEAIDSSHYLLTATLQNGWHPNYINSLVPGGWSITVEATFYLIAPLLFFRIRNWQAALGFVLVSLFLCMGANNCLRIITNHRWIFAQVQPDVMQQFYYRWFPGQLPIFACGILTYYILRSLPESFRTKHNSRLLLVTAVVTIYTMVGIAGHRLITDQVFFALGFLLLILGLAIYPFYLLVNPAICFLGRISYSFYLMHFVVMAGIIHFYKALVPSVFAKPSVAYFSLFAATLLIATPVSWITYKIVEQPFIRLGSLLVRRLNRSPEGIVVNNGALNPADSRH